MTRQLYAAVGDHVGDLSHMRAERCHNEREGDKRRDSSTDEKRSALKGWSVCGAERSQPVVIGGK